MNEVDLDRIVSADVEALEVGDHVGDLPLDNMSRLGIASANQGHGSPGSTRSSMPSSRGSFRSSLAMGPAKSDRLSNVGVLSRLSLDERALQMVRQRMQSHIKLKAKEDTAKKLIMDGLKHNRFCHSLAGAELDQVFSAAHFYHFEPGEEICAQGELGDQFFVVDSGVLSVVVNGTQTNLLRGGDSFGGIALLHKAPRTATVVAKQPCGLWGVGGVDFRRVMQEHARGQFEEYIRFVNGVGVFDGLTAKQKAKLCEQAVLQETFEANSRIITRGELATAMYIVKSGELGLYSGGAVNSEGCFVDGVRESTLRSGDWFGWRSTLYCEPNPMTAVTDTHCEFLTISIKHLKVVIGENLVGFLEQGFVHHSLRQLPSVGKLPASQRIRIVQAMTRSAHGPDTPLETNIGLAAIIDGSICCQQGQLFVELQRGDLFSPDGSLAALLAPGMPSGLRRLRAGRDGCRVATLSASALTQAYKDVGLLEMRSAEAAAHHIELVVTLRKVPIFNEITDLQLDAIVSSGLLARTYAGGAKILQQGDSAGTFLFLQRGYAQLIQDGVVTRSLGPGACIGERALIFEDDIAFAALEVTSDSAEFLSVDRESFAKVVAPGMLEELRQKMRMQDKTMSLKALRNVRVLGAGSFGAVRLVEEMRTRRPFVLKRFSRTAQGAVPSEALNEVRMLNHAGGGEHAFCLRILRTFETARNFYILVEALPGGTLRSHLSNLRNEVLDTSQAQFYLGSAVLALEALHDRNIVHRNVNPDSFILDARGYAKLTGFGHAKQLESMVARTLTITGVPAYIAPEVIRGRGYGAEADIWSLGVMLYELVCGWLPFGDPELIESADPTEMYADVLGGRLSFPAEYNEEHCERLIEGLLTREANLRLGNRMRGWEDVKQDIFFLAHPSGDFFALLRAREAEPPLPSTTELWPEEAEVIGATSLSDADDLGAGPTTLLSLKALFRHCDTNKDGELSEEELRRMLRKLDAKVYTDSVIADIVQFARTDENGVLGFQDFVSWLLSEHCASVRTALCPDLKE